MSEMVVDQLRKHPVLSQFCEPLPRLIEPGTPDVSRSVRRFGELLGHRPEQVSLGFRITGGATRFWRLQVDREGFSVTEEAADVEDPALAGASGHPDVEVIASEATWRAIAEGDLSPMAAMLAGHLRFRGDVLVASRVVHQLRRTGAGRPEKG